MKGETTDLVRRLLEAWNSHDPEQVASFYTPDYEGRDVGQARLETGPEGVKERAARYWRAFPDLAFKAQDIIVEGNRVSVVWTAHGTHMGMMMNIPPCGRVVEVTGVSLLTLSGGKIQQALYVWDIAGLLRKIGLLPELTA